MDVPFGYKMTLEDFAAGKANTAFDFSSAAKIKLLYVPLWPTVSQCTLASYDPRAYLTVEPHESMPRYILVLPTDPPPSIGLYDPASLFPGTGFYYAKASEPGMGVYDTLVNKFIRMLDFPADVGIRLLTTPLAAYSSQLFINRSAEKRLPIRIVDAEDTEDAIRATFTEPWHGRPVYIQQGCINSKQLFWSLLVQRFQRDGSFRQPVAGNWSMFDAEVALGVREPATYLNEKVQKHAIARQQLIWTCEMYFYLARNVRGAAGPWEDAKILYSFYIFKPAALYTEEYCKYARLPGVLYDFTKNADFNPSKLLRDHLTHAHRPAGQNLGREHRASMSLNEKDFHMSAAPGNRRVPIKLREGIAASVAARDAAAQRVHDAEMQEATRLYELERLRRRDEARAEEAARLVASRASLHGRGVLKRGRTDSATEDAHNDAEGSANTTDDADDDGEDTDSSDDRFPRPQRARVDADGGRQQTRRRRVRSVLSSYI